MSALPSIYPREKYLDAQGEFSVASQEKDQFETMGSVQVPSVRFGKKSAKKGILVVMEDPNIRKLIRLILEHTGYEIREAEDGQKAIYLLTRKEPSVVVELIITEFNMPKLDGFEPIPYFHKKFSNIPLIILTGIADVHMATLFMEQGVSDFLVLPVDARSLTTSVINALAQ